jgi:hypothetical protein
LFWSYLLLFLLEQIDVMKTLVYALLLFFMPLVTKADVGSFSQQAGGLTLEKNFLYNQTYNLNAIGSNAWSNAALGNDISSLVIKQIIINTFENNGDTVKSVSFYWRIQPNNSLSNASFQQEGLVLTNNIGGNKTFSLSTNNSKIIQLIYAVNIFTSYTIDCYFLCTTNTSTFAITPPGAGNFNNGSFGFINASLNSTSGIPPNYIFKANFITTGILSLNNIGGFGARLTRFGVALNYEILSAQFLQEIAIERSTNGISWQTIYSQGINNSTIGVFDFIDNNPVDGLNIYRLVGKTTNNTNLYSRMVRVSISGINNNLVLYPNPFVENSFTLNFNGIKKGKYDLVIYNLQGVRVFGQGMEYDGFLPSQTIYLPTALAKGTYYLLLTNKNEFYKQILLKQ